MDATEIAQDSFTEAHLNRGSCRGDWERPEVFGRWLRGVARNRYRMDRRRYARSSERFARRHSADLAGDTVLRTQSDGRDAVGRALYLRNLQLYLLRLNGPTLRFTN